jgi:uncharacterized Zn finger protein (UPF0148 family)
MIQLFCPLCGDGIEVEEYGTQYCPLCGGYIEVEKDRYEYEDEIEAEREVEK